MAKYYYFTGPDHLLEILRSRRIKVSRYADLNDPFELAPYDLADKDFRKSHKKILADFNNKIGLISLSRSWRSPAMWAHYAIKHTGACLEIDVSFDHLQRVDYRDQRLFPGISLQNHKTHLSIDNLRAIYATKGSDWAYENEERMNVPLDHDWLQRDTEGRFFLPFRTGRNNGFKLTKVITGFNCNVGMNKIRDELDRYKYKVESFQSRPAFQTFEVVEQDESQFWNLVPVDRGEKTNGYKAHFGNSDE